MNVQAEFSQYLRTSNQNHPKSPAWQIYHRLLRANLTEVLNGVYTRTIQALGLEFWNILIDRFFERYEAKTRYFYELPDEFLAFLWQNKGLYRDRPWLFALAHFEWMELALTVSTEVLAEKSRVSYSKSLSFKLSPLAHYCEYEYAVYPGDSAYKALAKRAQTWQGLVYRNREHQVRWFELDAWTVRIIQQFNVHGTMREDDLVHALIQQTPDHSSEQIRISLHAWCELWLKQDILIEGNAQ